MASYYPPVGFHFRVVFEGPFGDSDMRFQSVSGLNASIGNDPLVEGGENRFSHRLPKPPTYDNLILKRGMLVGSALLAWFRAAINSFEFHPTGITVILLSPDHVPVTGWYFENAYPVKWQVADLDAMQSQVLVETIEFSYQYFRQIEVPHVPGDPNNNSVNNNLNPLR